MPGAGDWRPGTDRCGCAFSTSTYSSGWWREWSSLSFLFVLVTRNSQGIWSLVLQGNALWWSMAGGWNACCILWVQERLHSPCAGNGQGPGQPLAWQLLGSFSCGLLLSEKEILLVPESTRGSAFSVTHRHSTGGPRTCLHPAQPQAALGFAYRATVKYECGKESASEIKLNPR